MKDNSSPLFALVAGVILGFVIGITLERRLSETRHGKTQQDTYSLHDVMLIHENGYLSGAINAFDIARSKTDTFHEVKKKDSVELLNTLR